MIVVNYGDAARGLRSFYRVARLADFADSADEAAGTLPTDRDFVIIPTSPGCRKSGLQPSGKCEPVRNPGSRPLEQSSVGSGGHGSQPPWTGAFCRANEGPFDFVWQAVL